jgi:hypothetical protein
MPRKKATAVRRSLPPHVRSLFMLGSGANTGYSHAEIRDLWEKHGRQFLQHLDTLDRTGSQFRKKPMIFSILNLDESAERKRFGI